LKEVNVEEMASFFDVRAQGYDQHMRDNIQGFESYYEFLAKPLEGQSQPIQILDLGCGTGLEFPYLLQAAPHASITGMDLSAGMMQEGAKAHKGLEDRITWKQASYVTDDLGHQAYEVVISSMTMHHFFVLEKRKIYQKIYAAVKPGGMYIEGDYMVSPEMEMEALAYYFEQAGDLKEADKGKFHLDIPFTVDKQVMLLKSVGFDSVRVIYRTNNNAILVAKKAEKA